MPQGELLLRTKRTIEAGVGWVDAYVRYGVSLEMGSLMRLMSPAPRKDPSGQSQPSSHGVSYLGVTIGKAAERQFSFDLHLRAPDAGTYLLRYQQFCHEILDCQYFQLKTKYEPDKVYHLLYMSAEPVALFIGGLGKFSLTVKEPHPEIHDARTTGFSNTDVG